jgi:hypothetical protein
MTMTIKLSPDMEQQLRQRSAARGEPASVLIREALAEYLVAYPVDEASAYALGVGLFGRHYASPDLASQRKAALAEVWTARNAARKR